MKQTRIAAALATSNYEKSNLPGFRKVMIQSIENGMEEIVKKGGSVLLSARQVLDGLQAAELLPVIPGRPLAGANSVGDVLGAKHFKLPFVFIGTCRKYLIPAVKWTPGEREEFASLEPSEVSRRLKNLEDELLPEEGLVAECSLAEEIPLDKAAD